MKMHAYAAVALAGLSTTAMGQSLSVHLSFDATDAAMGEIVTATLVASFTGHPTGAYLSSVNIDLIASTTGVYEVVSVDQVAWNNPALGFNGQGSPSGPDVLGIEASQFSLIPPFTSGSPILITTFDLMRVGVGGISYSVRAANDAPFLFSVTGGGFSDPVVSYGSEVFMSETLNGTPSPGVLGVLGAGGVLAGRRRRVG